MAFGKLQKKSSLLQVPFTLDVRERRKSPVRHGRSRTPSRERGSHSRERVSKITKKIAVTPNTRRRNKESLSMHNSPQEQKYSYSGNIQLSPFSIDTSMLKDRKEKSCKTQNRKSILELSSEDLVQISLLHGAVLKNDYELLRKLIIIDERDVNEPSYEGTTALHVASAAGYLDCLTILLECGACVDKKDIFNRTPLEYAVLYGNFDCAHELISFGANTNSIKDGISI